MRNADRQLTFDEILDALSAVQRRNVLVELLERASTTDTPVVDIDETDDRTQLRMDHVHAPKLASHGLIEWDELNREVKPGPNFEEIRPLLELLRRNEDDLPDDWIRRRTENVDGSEP